MEQILNADIAALQRMSTSDLRRRYAEVFDDQPPSWNRVWMLKRLAVARSKAGSKVWPDRERVIPRQPG